MATISNIIKTIFTSTGAQDVATDADRASRSVTRLGQASAGAGRQFAAQSQGLGGLVAAYAGAAATSFALQAAFTALANSARSLQTIEGLTALAANSGAAGQEILKNVQSITKGQLSLVESAQQINLALSAGFNTEQIEGLSEVALKASRALGRDLGDAMTRVTRGSAKMETELLDELGIYTKIEPSTRAYAAAIGKAVSQLTEYERRQAFVNAVIAEGQRKFSSINTTIPTAAEKIEAFGKRIIDLGTAVGAFIAERLAPLADFFTNNLAASIGAFGVVGSLILGKALSELGQKITNFRDSVENKSQAVNQRILKLTRASAEKITAAQTSVAGISLTAKGTTGIGAELKSLKELAAQRALNTQELAKAQNVLQRRIANLNTLRASEIQQIVAARQARAAATAGTAAYAAAQQTLTGLSNRLKTTNSLLAATTTQLNTVTTAATSSNAAMASFFSAVVLRGGMAVAAVARLGVAMVSLGGFVLSAASIIGILGSSIANAIGKGDEFNAWVKGLGDLIKEVFDPQIARDTRNVFQGLSAGALTNIESANQQIRELDTFKFRQKKVLGIDIKIEKTKEDLVKEVSALLANVSLDDGIDVAEAASTGTFWGSVIGGALVGGLAGSAFAGVGSIVGAIGGAVVGGASAIFAQVGDAAVQPTEQAFATVRQLYKRELEAIKADAGLGDTVATTAEKALAYLEDQYGAAAKLDPVAKAYLDTQRQIVLESVKYQASVNEIAAVIAATGKSADQVVKTFGMPKAISDISSQISATTVEANLELVLINKDKIKNELSTVITLGTQGVDPSKIQVIVEQVKALQEAARMSGEGFLSAGDALARMFENLPQGVSGTDISALSNLDPVTLNQLIKLGSGVIDLATPFSEAVTAGEGINASLIRTTDLLITVQEGINSGALDLEKFSQSTGNIAVALTQAKRELPDLETKISAAALALAKAEETNIDTTPYKLVLTELERQKDAIEANIDASSAQLDILKGQEGVLRNQLQLSKFLSDITPKEQNPFGIELDIFKATASNSAEELAITIDYLSQIVSLNSEAKKSYDSYASSVKDSGMGEDVQAQLLTASREGIQKTADTLKTIKGVEAQVVGDTIVVTDSLTKTTREFTPLNQAINNAASNSEKASEAIKGLAVEALSTAVSSMKQMMSEYDSLVKDIDTQLQDIARDNTLATIKFNADLSQVYRDIELLKQEALLEQLELDIDLTSAKVKAGAMSEVEGAKEENRIRQEILKQQEYLLLMEMGNDAMNLAARMDLLDQENANAIAQIELQAQQQRDKIAADLEYINALIGVYETNITSQESVNQSLISGFAQAGNNLTNTLAQVFTDASTALGTAIRTAGESTPGVSAINSSAPVLGETETAFESLRDSFVTSAGTALTAIDTQESALLQQQQTRYEQSQDLIEAEQDKIIANYEARMAALLRQGDIEAYNALAREKEAKESGKKDDELNDIEKRLKALFDSIKGNIENALMGLNNLIFYGEGSFNEIMGSFFKNLQQDFFKTTVAEPVSDFLTTSLFSALGVDAPALKKGTDGLSYRGDSLLVAVTNPFDFMNPAADPTKLLDEAGKDGKGIFGGFFDQITGMFSKIFGQGGFISNLFGKLFGGGGILSGLFKGIGGFFSSLLGFSQGGLVHLAAGGAAASATINRDRVPAMLEPGEFVIRKQSAQKIGMPALQSMNATGSAGGAGNVYVNVTNEGTGKTVEQSQPRFDGEKYIVDIVMRDIANNGPIRRSLRGRGGL